jgi:hypothetical protein
MSDQRNSSANFIGEGETFPPGEHIHYDIYVGKFKLTDEKKQFVSEINECMNNVEDALNAVLQYDKNVMAEIAAFFVEQCKTKINELEHKKFVSEIHNKAFLYVSDLVELTTQEFQEICSRYAKTHKTV